MTSNQEILNELLSLSPTLAEISNTNVFSVPDNYFNELPCNILQLVKAEIQPSFHQIGKQPALSVPQGYFDGLAGTLLSRIKAEASKTALREMETLSPAIAAIGNKNVFTVPDGYFDKLNSEVLDNIVPQPKVVEMKKRSGIIRYMAAAAVAGIIGLTIFNAADRSDNSVPATADPVMAEANKIIKNNSFDAELNTISGKDIEQYLTENGEDVDAALVASAADDANLPNAEDYIIDDNTLNEFLNKINLNN